MSSDDFLHLPELWVLDPEVIHLNHGSFGACTRIGLDRQSDIRRQMEANTLRFFEGDLPDLLMSSRQSLARFVGAEADNLVFVTNATTGVNTVLASLQLSPGDVLLVTNHGYNACTNAARYYAGRAEAVVETVDLPFPITDPDEVVEKILDACGDRTRFLLIDHVTSLTGLVLPLDRLVPLVQKRGIEVLVDGAHAPGMLPLGLESLGADYYTGNCHKWMCCPKGTGFLYVQPEHQGSIHPLVISHGMNRPLVDTSRFRLEFDWTGTWDPSGLIAIPTVIEQLGGLSKGGWAKVMERNKALAIEGRQIICQALKIEAPAPVQMLGSMAALRLPGSDGILRIDVDKVDPLKSLIRARHRIEVSLSPWLSPPGRFLRISAQLYNSLTDYTRLAEAVVAELAI
jgi:isopenicillin-N epimerase